MSIKKWQALFSVLLTMIVMMTPASHYAFAESNSLTQPSVNAIEVKLNDNYFNPNAITLPNGRPTTLSLKNEGVKEHTFTVAKLNIDTEIPAGKQVTINVEPKLPGTYELVCRYHANEGMLGKVIVK